MKYWALLWAGLWRRRLRTVLLVVPIVCAFALFGLLQSVTVNINRRIAAAHRDRLFVTSITGLQDPARSAGMPDALPLTMLARIRSVPGVERVNPRTFLGGAYQRPDQFVPVLGTDPGSYVALADEVLTSPQAIAALAADRTGAVAGRFLMQKYGWKIGEPIVLQSPFPKLDGSRDWHFDIVGVYDIKGAPSDSAFLIANIAYVNATRQINRDTADLMIVKVTNPDTAGDVALAIDNAFANSPHATLTQTEADFGTAQVQRAGDLGFMVSAIIGAVFFALLFSTGALMMQANRERLPELAVLKSVGFSDGRVVALILTESLICCVCSAGAGLGAARLLQPFARQAAPMVGVSAPVIAAGVALGAILALAVAGVPAWQSRKLPIATALQRR